MNEEDFYEDNATSNYIISVMGINTSDGTVVINGHRNHTEVADIDIESDALLVLPLEADEDVSIDNPENIYEEEVIETYDTFTIAEHDETPYSFLAIDCINDLPRSTKLRRLITTDISTPQIHACEICFKTFPSENSLSKHRIIHTNPQRYQCGICEKNFSQQSNLWKHIRAHTGERPFICTICNKAFTQLANLQKHNFVHTGEKPYRCPVCDKGFSQQANMMKHQVLHTGERPFVCGVCQKGFTQKSNLHKHELLHRGIKPYACQICFKAFAQQSNLRKHECQHMNHRPHKCEYCNKAYIQKISLSRHMERCSGSDMSEVKIPDSDIIAGEVSAEELQMDETFIDEDLSQMIDVKQEFIESSESDCHSSIKTEYYY